MTLFFSIFWSLLIFTSIAWYAFLLFYIGYKGWVEIRQMTKDLAGRPEKAADDTGSTDL